MESNTTRPSALKKGIIGIVSVVAIAGIAMYVSGSKKEEEVAETSITTKEETKGQTANEGQKNELPLTKEELAKTTVYKNGIYTNKGTYTSPAGEEHVEVSITLTDDIITSATWKGEATNPGSIRWQGEFSKGFSAAVVGKKIDEVALTVVNGSSLTPKGFMDALQKVKLGAKS